MIVEALITAITAVIKLIVIPFNVLPDTPVELKSAVDTYFGLIFNNLDFLNFFVHTSTLKTVALIAIAIWTLDKLYNLLIWIIHKLPVSIN